MGNRNAVQPIVKLISFYRVQSQDHILEHQVVLVHVALLVDLVVLVKRVLSVLLVQLDQTQDKANVADLVFLVPTHMLRQPELSLFQESKAVLEPTVCPVIPDVLASLVMLAELVNQVQLVFLVNQVWTENVVHLAQEVLMAIAVERVQMALKACLVLMVLVLNQKSIIKNLKPDCEMNLKLLSKR